MTTKEDQMRAGYKKWLDDNHLIEFPTDTSHPNQISYPFEAYKACAESYEKKLAEKGAAGDWRLAGEIVTLQDQLSEANARNARLVAAIESRIAADKYCRQYNHLIEAQEDCAQASQDADELMQQAITANSEAELKHNV